MAFQAGSRQEVDEFYAAAIQAGAKDNGKPGLRYYHKNYYGAFAIDPNGINLEAVFHEAE
jgi:predicted lactoylglutathione lyase